MQGYIVLTVGLFGHSGDSEVWEDMDEGIRCFRDSDHEVFLKWADKYGVKVGAAGKKIGLDYHGY